MLGLYTGEPRGLADPMGHVTRERFYIIPKGSQLLQKIGQLTKRERKWAGYRPERRDSLSAPGNRVPLASEPYPVQQL